MNDVERRRLASRIGGRLACGSVMIGLVLAALFFLFADEWDPRMLGELITKWLAQFLICVFFGPWIGYTTGAWVGRKVILGRWPAFWASLLAGVITVLSTSLLFTSLECINQLHDGWREALVDYMLAPIYLIFLFGGIPMLVCATIMALLLRRTRRRLAAQV